MIGERIVNFLKERYIDHLPVNPWRVAALCVWMLSMFAFTRLCCDYLVAHATSWLLIAVFLLWGAVMALSFEVCRNVSDVLQVYFTRKFEAYCKDIEEMRAAVTVVREKNGNKIPITKVRIAGVVCGVVVGILLIKAYILLVAMGMKPIFAFFIVSGVAIFEAKACELLFLWSDYHEILKSKAQS